MKNVSIVAFNIKKLINTLGIKQYVVAQKAGIKYSKFNDMLNGRRVIKADDVIPIAKVLGVTPNDLYKEDKSQQ